MVAPKRTRNTHAPCGTCGRIVPQGNCPRHPKSKRRRTKGQRRMTETLANFTTPVMCAYCDHRPATSTDHVVPPGLLDDEALARFGILSADDWRNLLPACHRCNTSKHGRRLSTWVQGGKAPDRATDVLRERVAAGLPH